MTTNGTNITTHEPKDPIIPSKKVKVFYAINCIFNLSTYISEIYLHKPERGYSKVLQIANTKTSLPQEN